MALKAGIVGLPNVGKSTLFNAISQNVKAQASNYRFCTIEPNVGLVDVPDKRLTQLANLVKPNNIVPTQIEIVDIAGLVKGASKGEGLGNKFLANIREVHAIIEVVRCFEDINILRDEGPINPLGDINIIETELQLKDLESIEKKIARTEKQAKASSDNKLKNEYNVLVRCKEALNKGLSVRTLQLDSEEQIAVSDLFLLTQKPILYLANVLENDMHTGNAFSDQVKAHAQSENAQCIVMCNSIEEQIAEFTNPDDKHMFLEEYKIEEPCLDRLIQITYQLLELETYFTAGVQEVRAWTIPKGCKAPQAAAVIHTDFEKGFIKAETIAFSDFIKLGSEAACREHGKLRIEGKDYIVKDGDILHFRFNV
ncbi:MAG: redox-regulated ATPase YchF [Alphaproteobacteria bacterium]|nr:redox-regulated ATPase YchF [Alphaproteobacteria bacterium]